MLNSFKKINSDEINSVSGGCQCICNRKPDISTEDLYNIGKAKSLGECSDVCLKNGWKITKCDASAKKEDKDKDK